MKVSRRRGHAVFITEALVSPCPATFGGKVEGGLVSHYATAERYGPFVVAQSHVSRAAVVAISGRQATAIVSREHCLTRRSQATATTQRWSASTGQNRGAAATAEGLRRRRTPSAVGAVHRRR